MQRISDSQSHSWVLQLKHQLKTTYRGHLSITKFVAKQIDSIADNFALAGKPGDERLDWGI